MGLLHHVRMRHELMDELTSLLQGSDARLRKHWAERISREQIPLSSLMTLLHGHQKTAQRFTWLIGDLLDFAPDVVADCLPILFDLRDQMPFPGMQRTVAKCFWYLGVPKKLEPEVIPQLLTWLEDNEHVVSIKHYASKALYDLAIDGRVDVQRLDRILEHQSQHENKAHAGRMLKLRLKLSRTTQS